jgi:hypothetical protein
MKQGKKNKWGGGTKAKLKTLIQMNINAFTTYGRNITMIPGVLNVFYFP